MNVGAERKESGSETTRKIKEEEKINKKERERERTNREEK